MSSNQEPIKILAPESFRRRCRAARCSKWAAPLPGWPSLRPAATTRRSPATPRRSRRNHGGHRGSRRGGTAAAGAGGVGDSGTGLGVAPGDYSRVTNKSSGSLNMYTWGAYNDPDIVGSLAEKDLGVKMQVSYYTSNEDLITKLQASKGTSGFDIVVPTGPYIPQMIQNGLLEKFDKIEAAQHGQRRPAVPRPGVGPDQRLQRLQGLGLDRLVLRQDEDQDARSRPGATSSPCARARPARTARCSTRRPTWPACTSGRMASTGTPRRRRTSMHARSSSSTSSPRTSRRSTATRPTRSPRARTPSSMMWNGDARAAYPKIADAGGNPDDWVWGLGAPDTELWMDNYCHRCRRTEPRCRPRLDQLDPDSRGVDQRPRLPRLQLRHEEHEPTAHRAQA